MKPVKVIQYHLSQDSVVHLRHSSETQCVSPSAAPWRHRLSQSMSSFTERRQALCLAHVRATFTLSRQRVSLIRDTEDPGRPPDTHYTFTRAPWLLSNLLKIPFSAASLLSDLVSHPSIKFSLLSCLQGGNLPACPRAPQTRQAL